VKLAARGVHIVLVNLRSFLFHGKPQEILLNDLIREYKKLLFLGELDDGLNVFSC
jgi:hypothetical protein